MDLQRSRVHARTLVDGDVSQMTFVEPMTPRELLELASLDAVGLLDTVEEAVFTRSFHDAPATVQDEVLRRQAEIANDLSLLPGDEPDPNLRERVLKAVAAAVEREEATLAPLARIGRRRSAAERETGSSFGLTGSGQFWRAASFALAGVSLIMVYFMAVGAQSSRELYIAAINDDIKKLEVLLDPQPAQFLVDASQKVPLSGIAGAVPFKASLYINDTSGEILILHDLPRAKNLEYVLQVVGKDEVTHKLQAFSSSGIFGGITVKDVPLDLIATAVRWQIATLDNVVILTSS